jgi:hypothetical protein
MTDTVALSPDRFASLVAPAVTRTFVAAMRSPGESARDLIASYGGREAIGYLIDLRNPLAAGRPLSPEGLAAVFRYHQPADIDTQVRRSIDAGLLVRADDDAITATDRGLAFLSELAALQAAALDERWRAYRHFVEPLNSLTARVLAEAAATAGASWAVQAPPHEPDGTPPDLVLMNRLSTLRYHRADAHAAAWQAAGLTAADVVAMPWGSEWTPPRQAVEDDTNARAGVPYAVLTPDERLRMLADLAALP